jgi:exodeoxyribonuclease VII small subunit
VAKKMVKKARPQQGPAQQDSTLTFEQTLEQLEKIVGRLEDGRLGLDEALADYERGVKYLKHCYQQLERAERKIELLAGVDQDGTARTTPFGEDDMTLEQKQVARSRRRSRSSGSSRTANTSDSESPDSESRDAEEGGGMDAPGSLF